MALPLKIKPKTLTLTLNPARSLRPFSSPPDDSNGGEGNKPPSSYSSYISEIKERLKSTSSPPRRISTDPLRPSLPPFSFSPRSEPETFNDIRKHLAEFRLKSPNPNPKPSMSFQELANNTVLSNSDASRDPARPGRPSFLSVRENLRPPRLFPRENTKSSSTIKSFEDSFRGSLAQKVFDPELREKKGEAPPAGEGEGKGDVKRLKTEFVKMYNHKELGEKLRNLRPAAAAKGKKDWFSLEELNSRLVKLRELEEKETNHRMAGVAFTELRESLVRLSDANKKSSMQKLSILSNIGMHATPAFKLKPPQEQLLKNVSVW